MTEVDPEAGADALLRMAEHLTGPLAAGAAVAVAEPAADGAARVPPARRRTLLLALRRSLGAEDLVVTATPAGAPPVTLRLASWSEAGSALVVAGSGEGAPEGSVALSATLGGRAVPPEEVADWLDLQVVEGNTGRLLALLGGEKARLRREMARLAAARSLRHAQGDALDRVGAELGLLRLDARLDWDAARSEIVSVPAPEGDAAFRERLGVWRPFLAPTPAAVRALLARVDPRVALVEPEGVLAVAVRLVGAEDAAADPVRARLLEAIRRDRLSFLAPGPGDALHAARPMTEGARDAEAAMRRRLAAAFEAEPEAALAPRLAAALDRAARVLLALDGPRLRVVQAQDGAGGSRHDLGLGAVVALPSAARAEALRAALLDEARAATDDPLAEALIRRARAAPPERRDRSLGWLWRAADLATHHRLDAGHVVLSHLPAGGLTIAAERDGPVVALRAVFEAPGDPGVTAPLRAALDAALAGGLPVRPADAAAVAGALDVAGDAPEAQVLAAAGLPSPAEGARAAAALARLPPDAWAALAVEDGLSDLVRAGDPDAVAALRAVAEALRRAGVPSLLPLVAPGGLVLVAGAVPLPVAGLNLGERASAGVRWLAVPLAGTAALSRATGLATELRLSPGGLAAVVALGHVRGAGPDPYELHASLPEGELLDLAGYERLMNALERAFPVGVEINTWDLRRRGVDLDGDGRADPLPPRVAQHYRRWRTPRQRGMEEPDEAQGPADGG